MKKILTLYLTESEEGEKYSLEWEKGFCMLDAFSHLAGAAAEGLMEMKEGMLKRMAEIEQGRVNRETGDH